MGNGPTIALRRTSSWRFAQRSSFLVSSALIGNGTVLHVALARSGTPHGVSASHPRRSPAQNISQHACRDPDSRSRTVAAQREGGPHWRVRYRGSDPPACNRIGLAPPRYKVPLPSTLVYNSAHFTHRCAVAGRRRPCSRAWLVPRAGPQRPAFPQAGDFRSACHAPVDLLPI